MSVSLCSQNSHFLCCVVLFVRVCVCGVSMGCFLFVCVCVYGVFVSCLGGSMRSNRCSFIVSGECFVVCMWLWNLCFWCGVWVCFCGVVKCVLKCVFVVVL